MKNAKHTPGPWRTYENEGRQIIATTSSWAYAATGLLPDNDKPTEIANAYLIAAAPELLEALRDVEWIQVEHGEDTFCPHCRAWHKYGHNEGCPLAAAIAKAEGGAE